MTEERLYSSTELMTIAGVTRKALRVLQRKGLIWTVTHSGNRRFDRGALDRLLLIQQLREVGLGLDEIKEIMQVRDDEGAEAAPVAADLARDLSEIVRVLGDKVESLLRIRKQLIEAREQLFECSGCHEPLAQCKVCGEHGRLAPIAKTLLVPVANGTN